MEALNDEVPSPSGLYTSDDLLGGWSPDAPLSYATTLDARVFSAAVAAGLRTPGPTRPHGGGRCTTTSSPWPSTT